MDQCTDNFSNSHFWFDKKLIENRNWAKLSKSSKTVYPVIVAHCNKLGVSYPGESRISMLSGKSEKTVRKGITKLKGFPGFQATQYLTKNGRRSKMFKISQPLREPKRAFPIYKTIFTYGFWMGISQTAQALYPVMRHFSYFKEEIYFSEEDDYYVCHDDSFKEMFSKRAWDFCNAEIPILAEFAGIAKRSVYDAIKSLENNYLIKPMTHKNLSGWRVYLRPERLYLRKDLNEPVLCEHTPLNYELTAHAECML